MAKLVLGETNMNLERLYFLREKCDLTQEQMGKIVGVKKFSISNWEKTKEIIPLEKLNIYSNYFNISLDYILNLSDNPKSNLNTNHILDKSDIGNRLKQLRIKNNLSQREMAKILNTTQSAVWSYETGKTLILTAFAYQICKHFNVSMDWICGK